MQARFDYMRYLKTRERATRELDHLFAAGEVSESEQPRIEPDKWWHHETGTLGRSWRRGFKITLLGV